MKYNEISEFVAVFPNTKDIIEDLYSRYNKLLNNLIFAYNEEIEYPKNISSEENKKYAENVFKVLNKYNLHQSFSSLFFMKKDGKNVDIRKYLMNYENKKLIEKL